MATNSLHLTTFCLQHKPTVIACVCIHLACKWSNWEIPVSTEGKHWWEYLDRTVTLQLLDELSHEFLHILEKSPNTVKRISKWRATKATTQKPKSDGQTVHPQTSHSDYTLVSSDSSSSQKRAHPDAQQHHSAKRSRKSKGAAAHSHYASMAPWVTRQV